MEAEERAQHRKSKSDRLVVLEEVGPSWGLCCFSLLFVFVEAAVAWYWDNEEVLLGFQGDYL